MEEKGQSQQEKIPARVSTYSSILPSMPQESDSQDLPSQAASQATPHSNPQISGFTQHFAQPRATHPSAEPGRLVEGGILPTASQYRHSPYSSITQGGGTYSPLLHLGAVPPPGISPVQPYPGFGSYQSPVYGYGSSGQGFSYDTHSSIPNAPLGVPGSQSGYGSASIVAPPALGFPYFGSGYPQQYSGHAGHVYDGAARRGHGHYQGGPYPPVTKSYAKNPGKPIFKNDNRLGPEGANLFVFHIPNEMTNYDLFQLFQSYGNVLSVRIMTEEATGRGRGYGFVSYDSAESAAMAIHHLNGLPIQGKRLKVQYKQIRHDPQDRQSFPSYAGSILPAQDYAARLYEPRQQDDYSDQPPISGFVPIRESETPGAKSPVTGSNREHDEGRDTTPSAGFMPVEDNAQFHKKTRDFGAILPSIDDLNTDIDFSSNQGEQRSSQSPSPLSDMKNMRRALPDP